MVDVEALLQNLSHRVGVRALGEFLNRQHAKSHEVEILHHQPKQGVFVVSVNIPGLFEEQRKKLKEGIESWTETGFLVEALRARAS
ncbi:hypothetical protein HZC09_02195 [Candidatus Micrarchaeota archaeon]|nr:hypothetical protein [Candidatus Micrarchaeota archaeon]